jgi:DNA-binding LacI/PurR family transcriptional regulator
VHWDDPVVANAATNPVGVIFVSSAEDVPAHLLRSLRESKSVSLDRDLSHHDVPSIHLYPDAHIHKVFSHLQDLGHQRIDCISTQYHNPEIERRIRLWREYLQRYDMTGELHERPTQSFGDATSAAHHLMQELLAKGAMKSKAFVGTTFPAAIGAIRACWEKGLVVGRDVSICAMNIESPAQFMTPSVTGLDMPNLSKLLRRCFDWFAGSGEWTGSKCMEPSRAQFFAGESTGPVSSGKSLELKV